MYLDKTLIKQSFAAASATYDSVASLQRAVGRELLRGIDAVTLTGTLVDLGCGTGFLTGELLARSTPETLIALDIARPMLRATQARLKGRRAVFYVCADAEYLPFAGHSLDGVFSNLALQWCINLDAVFAGIKRALKPGGRLVFSTFGPQTLRELKGAWAEVDHYSHVNEFYSPMQLQQFLQQAGFTNIRLESTLYSPRHASVWTLMHELKQLGAHHVMTGRNKKTTTRTALRQMLAAYEKHRIDGLIPATFEVVSVSAEA